MLDMAEFLASRRRRISSDRSRKEQGRGKKKKEIRTGKKKKGNLKHKGEKGAGGQLLSSSLVTFFSFFPVCMQDMVERKVANCNYY